MACIQVPLGVCLCMHNVHSPWVCAYVCPCINSACQCSVRAGLRAADAAARPRAKQKPDWSKGPCRAPGGPLMELSSCLVLAVQQPPLLSHTYHFTHHTHALRCYWRLSSFSSAGVSTKESSRGTAVGLSHPGRMQKWAWYSKTNKAV